jgi:uncharacterized membrane protein YoaK (UPF0700 family)
MNDRVVDRAAAHATPAELAVRDWLLVGLSLATGMYEAICFLTFGKVFTAAQTGNLVLLGIGVAGTHQPAGPNAVTVIISLAAFAVGAALRCRSSRRSTAIRNPKMTMSSRPAVVTAVVIAIAWVVLKPRPTSGRASEQGLPVQQAVK